MCIVTELHAGKTPTYIKNNLKKKLKQEKEGEGEKEGK